MQTDRVRLETTIADTARLHDDVLANKQEVILLATYNLVHVPVRIQWLQHAI